MATAKLKINAKHQVVLKLSVKEAVALWNVLNWVAVVKWQDLPNYGGIISDATDEAMTNIGGAIWGELDRELQTNLKLDPETYFD